MNLTLKQSDPDQYTALYAIMALAGEHMHRVLGLSHWHPFPAVDWFIKHCEGKEVFGVYADELLVGTFNISTIPERYYKEDMSDYWRKHDEPTMYFSAFGLLPSHQQKGIGSWVMAEVDKMVQARGYNQLRFDAVATHAKLLAFYSKAGYEQRGILDLGRAQVMCFQKFYD